MRQTVIDFFVALAIVVAACAAYAIVGDDPSTYVSLVSDTP